MTEKKDVNAMRLSRAILALVGVAALMLTGTPASAQPVNDTSDIVMYGTDLQGKEAPLRRGYWNGSAGSGADKLYYKHKIDNFNLFTSTMLDPAAFIETTGGTVWQYNQEVKLLHCDETFLDLPYGDCEFTEEDNLKLVVDYRTNTTFPTEDTTYGVVTMYCTEKGTQECEPWVNETTEYPAQGAWPFVVS